MREKYAGTIFDFHGIDHQRIRRNWTLVELEIDVPDSEREQCSTTGMHILENFDYFFLRFGIWQVTTPKWQVLKIHIQQLAGLATLGLRR